MKSNIITLVLTVFIMGLLLVTLDRAHHNTIMLLGIPVVSVLLWRLDLRVLAGLNLLLILGLFLR
jgi:hypothetical protein